MNDSSDEMLRGLLITINEIELQILWLFFWRRESLREIAEKMNFKEETIKKVLEKLARKIQEEVRT